MYLTTRAAVIATPLPTETKTYKPVTNERLIDVTLNSIVKAGFTLGGELYKATDDGSVTSARYTITNVADEEMALQIGWQNSYNKSVALKFAIGANIFICSNGVVSGDLGAFRKKHTGKVQTFTPEAVAGYIQQASDVFTSLQVDREAMKQTEVGRRIAAELVGRLFLEEEIIASTQLNIIKGQIANPSFSYGAPGSLWELYQHTTYALKAVHPSQWLTSHAKAHNFFKRELGNDYTY
jgi:hypothetical protein